MKSNILKKWKYFVFLAILILTSTSIHWSKKTWEDSLDSTSVGVDKAGSKNKKSSTPSDSAQNKKSDKSSATTEGSREFVSQGSPSTEAETCTDCPDTSSTAKAAETAKQIKKSAEKSMAQLEYEALKTACVDSTKEKEAPMDIAETCKAALLFLATYDEKADKESDSKSPTDAKNKKDKKKKKAKINRSKEMKFIYGKIKLALKKALKDTTSEDAAVDQEEITGFAEDLASDLEDEKGCASMAKYFSSFARTTQVDLMFTKDLEYVKDKLRPMLETAARSQNTQMLYQVMNERNAILQNIDYTLQMRLNKNDSTSDMPILTELRGILTTFASVSALTNPLSGIQTGRDRFDQPTTTTTNPSSGNNSVPPRPGGGTTTTTTIPSQFQPQTATPPQAVRKFPTRTNGRQ